MSNSVDKLKSQNYEAIVIGSGATGGLAALTLAEQGLRVLVIEAGPRLSATQALGSEPCNSLRRLQALSNGKHFHQVQHPGYWKSNPLLYSDERENPYTYPKDAPFYWTQGRQVGGRSLTWGGITLRLSDDEFNSSFQNNRFAEWPLDHSDLDLHYSSIERRLLIHGNCDQLLQLPDGYYQDPLPFTPSENSFSDIIQKGLDYPIIHSRGFGPHNPENDGEWPLFSSLGSTMAMAISTGLVEILSEHMAENLVMNPSCKYSSGVVVVDQSNGCRHQLKADLIVLCASTIQSLRFLLNSESTNHSEGFVDPSGMLGLHLMDHVSTCRFFTIPRENLPADQSTISTYQLSGAGSFLIPFGQHLDRSESVNFQGGYGLWGGIERFEPPGFLKRHRETVTGFLVGHGEVLSDHRNAVTLSEKTDQWGVHVPHISCEWRDNELAMVKHMQSQIEKIVSCAGGAIRPFHELLRLPFVGFLLKGAVGLRDAPPPPGYYVHEVGGAPMGVKESNSVVNNWNQLWRCRNVLVVDGACWPTSGWQSPTLTMMAITRRACLHAVTQSED